MNRTLANFQDLCPYINKLLPDISSFKNEKISHYDFQFDGLYNKESPYLAYTTSRGCKVSLEILFISKASIEICAVTVNLNGQWWSLDQHEICFSTHSESDQVFPQFKFRWNAYDTRSDHLGQLNYAEYIVEKNQSIFFHYPNSLQEERILRNLPDYPELPSTLIGQSEFLGHPLVWQIDVAKKSEEILLASELENFIMCI